MSVRNLANSEGAPRLEDVANVHRPHLHKLEARDRCRRRLVIVLAGTDLGVCKVPLRWMEKVQ